MTNNFIGMDGFLWFYGVVEDRQAPYMIGRVRVRCFGHHTGNKTTLPTADLPWAQVMLPVTSAGISGIGQTPLGLVEGSHVFGFFRDGEARQEPVVMGSLPGYPTELANTDTGFYDPNGEFPRYKNAPDTTQLATMIEYNPSQHASITADVDVFNRFQDVGTAVVDAMPLASQFISKGSSSLFGFVADIITSQVASALGSNILNTVGGSLTGFTKSVVGGELITTVDNLAPLNSVTRDFLKLKGGFTDALVDAANFVTESLPDGVVKLDILSDVLPSPSQLLDMGMTAAGVDPDTGQFRLNVSNVDTIAELVKAPASADAINAFQAAEVALADKSVGVTPQDLGVKTPIGLLETAENQSAIALQGAREVASTATGGAADLVRVVDKVTGVTSAIVDDEFQDSLSAKGRFGGSFGIPQKSTLSTFGVNKLINNSLGAINGVAAAWSLPQVPKLSDSYPKKHVFESESGHFMMYDDNDGNETIQQRHRSGTQYNMAADGTRTDVVVSDHITGIGGSSYNVIQEDNILTVNGRCKVFIN